MEMKFLITKILLRINKIILLLVLAICIYELVVNISAVIAKSYTIVELAKIVIFGIILFCIVIVIIIGRIKKIIHKGSILTMTLEGDFTKGERDFLSLLKKKGLNFYELLQVLDYALKDPKVDQLLIRIHNLSLGWGRLSELQDHLLKWKQNGKKVICFLGDSINSDYYLATASSKICMSMGSILFFNGLVYEIPFYKGLADKLGISFEIEHSGMYKTSFDQFIYEHMQAEQREMTQRVLEQIQEELISKVMQGRMLNREEVLRFMQEGIFTATNALDNKLIDDITTMEEFKFKLFSTNRKAHFIDARKYFMLRGKKMDAKAKKNVGLIYIEGMLQEGESGYHPTFGKICGTDDVLELLNEAEKESMFCGVILRINSPGGSGTSAEVLWQRIKQLAAKKPVVAVMGDVAASGGYYIASAATHIIASPLTITGSIGVISGKISIEGLLSKLNINVERIKLNDNADIMSLFSNLTANQREKLRRINDEFYRLFVKRVAEGRKLKEEEVLAAADGRIWIATDALKYKLIDEIGGLTEAVTFIKEYKKIPPAEQIRIYELIAEKPFWEKLRLKVAT
jgi:protease-4